MSTGTAQKSRDTGPELALRRALLDQGLTGYRTQHRITLPTWGKRRQYTTPDVCYIGAKITVFVQGCFWHGCSVCGFRDTKTNPATWRKKRAAVRARDERHHRALATLGWRVLIYWEHQPAAAGARAVQALLGPPAPGPGIYVVPDGVPTV